MAPPLRIAVPQVTGTCARAPNLTPHRTAPLSLGAIDLALRAMRTSRPDTDSRSGPTVLAWRLVRPPPPSHYRQPTSAAGAASARAFDAALRRRQRHIAALRSSASVALATHATSPRESAPCGPRPFTQDVGGLGLRHPSFRSRFMRRLRHERPRSSNREFCPRGLVPSDMATAIATVSAASGYPHAALTAAVASATSWSRPAPYATPPRGAHLVPSGISVSGILALDAPHDETLDLISVATRGASTMSACPKSRAWRENHPSAYHNPPVTDALVAERLNRGWMIRVTDLYKADPLLPVLVSPMGVVPKSTPGKFRLILDGSFGVGDCVNDFSHPDAVGTPVLASFDAVISTIATLRQRNPSATILLYSTDIDSAYMRIPVRAEDLWQLAQVWRGEVYWNTSAPFGLRPSGHWLYRFTRAFDRRVLSLCGHAPQTYVDDSIIAALEGDMPLCKATMDSVPASVGFPTAAAKSPPPSTQRTFCGWTFDSAAMTVSLPSDKLARLRAAVARHANCRRIPRSELVSLVGSLQSASRGIRCSRAYTTSLHAAAASSSGHWAVLPPDSRADLRYWSDLLRDFNGVTIISPQEPSATIFTDASSSWGWGWVCHDLGIYGYGPWSDDPDLVGVHINALEAACAVAASVIVASLLPVGAAVSLRSDNTSALAVTRRESGTSGPLNNAARALAYLRDTRPFSISPSHIQGVLNHEADALSRGSVPSHLLRFRRIHFPSLWLTSILSSPRPSLALRIPRG